MRRPTLVVLHGANGSAAEMAPLVRMLDRFDVRAPDLLGHGGRPPPPRLDFDDMVEDLATWLDAEEIADAHLVGYSFGAYVALALAVRRPTCVRSLTAIAMTYWWDAARIRHVVHLADPERLSRPGNPRQEQLSASHGADQWRQVTLNNQALFASFGRKGPPLTDRLVARVGIPVLVLTGAEDPLVPAAEARHVADAFPHARLGLWPGAAHPLIKVPLVEVKYAVTSFIDEVEAGSFRPGPELKLARALVAGGLPGKPIDIHIRRGGSG